MSFPSQSPYDILDVSPSASQREIMLAYQKAVKAGRYPATILTQAFHDLRNAQKRAELDMLAITGLPEPLGVAEMIDRECSTETMLGAPPPLPIGLAITSLASADTGTLVAELPATAQALLPPAETVSWGSLPQIAFPD